MGAPAASVAAPGTPVAGTASRVGAIARRTLADSRVRNISYAAGFALLTYANTVGYRSTYPTLRERLDFARAFGDNASVRLFYGRPHDLLTIGGYTAWRMGGFLAIFAGMWGALAAVRALRAEEDSGRQELVLAGVLSRAHAYLGALTGVGVGALGLWLALLLGLAGADLPVGESAYLALAIVTPAAVFAGVGALASQLAPTRRLALEMSSAVLGLALVLRVVADTAGGLQWLDWTTPLGWSEEMRAFTGARPAVLLAPLAACALLLAGAGAISGSRDVGGGLLRSRDSAAPRLTLLSSPTALALREERGSLAGWLLGTGFFALIVGLVSRTVASAGVSTNLERELQKLGAVQITKPSGYIGLSFLFFILTIGLFCCAQVASARHEEAQERLETLFALPVRRRRWLAGRLALALGGAVALALAAGLLAWLGATAENTGVSLLDMLGAGANCLPVALLFLGVAALGFALFPRAGAALGYGLIVLAFVWDLFGDLLGAPTWLLEASPFQHVGLVPAQPFQAGAAVAMLAVGGVCALAALWAFARRDVIGQ